MRGKLIQPDLMAALRANKGGMLVCELVEALGVPRESAIQSAVFKLRERGLVKWVLAPGFKAGFRCRWYATEHAPRNASSANPGDARTQQREALKTHRAVRGPRSYDKLDAAAPVVCNVQPTVVPHGVDHRHTFVGTPGRWVDSSQCRPWAAAVRG